LGGTQRLAGLAQPIAGRADLRPGPVHPRPGAASHPGQVASGNRRL